MTLNFKKQSLTYLSIALLVFLLIASPVAFVIAAVVLILYWYGLGVHKKNEQFSISFGATNVTLWLIACGLMLASLAIYHTEAYITQVVTLLRNGRIGGTLWPDEPKH